MNYTAATNPLLQRLRHHVTGAIERGEAEAIEARNAESRAFAIEQIRNVMEKEKAARSERAKAHAAREAEAAKLEGSRDWSK